MAGVRRLRSFPGERLVRRPLVTGRASELDVLTSLGPPTQASDPADEPVFDWDLQFPCELVLSVRLDQRSEHLEVRIDGADIDHALRHLGVAVDDLVRLDEQDPAGYVEACGGAPDLGWELWRLDDDGVRELVAAGLTKRDAFCRQAEFEGLGHKQQYFAMRAG